MADEVVAQEGESSQPHSAFKPVSMFRGEVRSEPSQAHPTFNHEDGLVFKPVSMFNRNRITDAIEWITRRWYIWLLIGFTLTQALINRNQHEINEALIQRIHAVEKMR